MANKQALKVNVTSLLISSMKLAIISPRPFYSVYTSKQCINLAFIKAQTNPAAVSMAVKRPLCNYSGVIKELLSTDTLVGNTLVSREVPSGTKNGSNCVFNLVSSPISGSEQVFLNGVLQNQGAGNDYTISVNSITFLLAPVSTDIILVTYWK